MRITTIFRKLLGITKLFVQNVSLEAEGLVIEVRPSWRLPRCSGCQKPTRGYDTKLPRLWRHLPQGRTVLWLRYTLRRVDCLVCGVRVEHVPWAAPGSRFTHDFEEMVAYYAQITDKTRVTELMGISWVTVGSIVHRIVSARLDPARLEKLRRIGVDEFSYRKHHRYLTTVVDHDQRRVVWAAKGNSSQVLDRFFDELGGEGCLKITEITLDMSEGYLKAIRNRLPKAEVIFDRFHVQRLASDAVDAVRRAMVREIEDPQEAKAIKRSRFALLKNPWNLTQKQEAKLSEVQQTNVPLYRAYLLKQTLAKALDYVQPKRASKALKDWLAWASRSKLKPFVKMARTVRRYFDGILAYVKTRLTNGLVEGLNNKLRVIARRAYGFHSAEALISMLFLNSGGIRLDPPLPEINPFEL